MALSLDLPLTYEVIADHFGVAPERLTPATRFQPDLGADSLDLIELTLRLETELGIRLDDAEAERCPDVGSAVRLLQEKMQVAR